MKKVQFKSNYSQYLFLAPQLGILLIFLYPTFSLFSQTFYSVDYSYQADIKVHVVDYEYQADLLVYKLKNKYE